MVNQVGFKLCIFTNLSPYWITDVYNKYLAFNVLDGLFSHEKSFESSLSQLTTFPLAYIPMVDSFVMLVSIS